MLVLFDLASAIPFEWLLPVLLGHPCRHLWHSPHNHYGGSSQFVWAYKRKSRVPLSKWEIAWSGKRSHNFQQYKALPLRLRCVVELPLTTLWRATVEVPSFSCCCYCYCCWGWIWKISEPCWCVCTFYVWWWWCKVRVVRDCSWWQFCGKRG